MRPLSIRISENPKSFIFFLTILMMALYKMSGKTIYIYIYIYIYSYILIEHICQSPAILKLAGWKTD